MLQPLTPQQVLRNAITYAFEEHYWNIGVYVHPFEPSRFYKPSIRPDVQEAVFAAGNIVTLRSTGEAYFIFVDDQDHLQAVILEDGHEYLIGCRWDAKTGTRSRPKGLIRADATTLFETASTYDPYPLVEYGEKSRLVA